MSGDPRPQVMTEFASYLTSIDHCDLDEQTISWTKTLVLDFVGVALLASRTPFGQKMVQAMVELEPSGNATIIGSGFQPGCLSAALCNAGLGHGFEYDDFGGCGHSGAVVIPAALAAGEQQDVDGAVFLRSVVRGYEAASRVADSLGGSGHHNRRGWHATGTCGCFGSATAVAGILGLDKDQLADALGLAGTYTGGVHSFLYDGADAKRLHAGRAAANGLSSAYLARAGVTGSRHLFGPGWGTFWDLYGDQTVTPEALIADPDGPKRILRSGTKMYPVCRSIHGPIESILGFMAETGVQADQIEAIGLRCSPGTFRVIGNRRIESSTDAQMSLPYCVALACLRHEVGVDQFGVDRFALDPAALAYMDRISVDADPGYEEEAVTAVVVRVAGQLVDLGNPDARGGAGARHSQGELLAKFQANATPVVGDARAGQIADQIMDLPDAGSIRPILKLCRIPTPLPI